MTTHAEIGAKTLIDIYEGAERNDFINMAIDIAWYHHENWDGTGYPKGLKGEEIPLAARIVRVVDVFDAMISERRYKGPYIIWFHLHGMSRICKFLETESSLIVGYGEE